MSRDLIPDEEFKSRHRSQPTAFSRIRTLTFSNVMIRLLRKSLKSLQWVLNEMAEKRDGEVVTAGALTPARANWRDTAFIELNPPAVVEVRYRDDDLKRYQGLRVLAIEGSKILLPKPQSVVEEFSRYQTRVRCAHRRMC